MQLLQHNQIKVIFILSCQLCLHRADIWVEAGEDDAPFSASLQNTGQDDIEEGIHVEVGRQVVVP